MNPHKYFLSADLISNPLCGIDTYKDTLNLASGQTTRKIKKLVLTGEESYTFDSTRSQIIFYVSGARRCIPICTHYKGKLISDWSELANGEIAFHPSDATTVRICDTSITSADNFKTYLRNQYAAGTPVTIWYVLATPTTETISLPSGLSGTIEGSLTQSGTPTPSAPIYPTAVTGEGWYDINTYKRSVLVWNTDTAYERESGAWT